MEISLLILISFLITKDMLPSTREAVMWRYNILFVSAGEISESRLKPLEQLYIPEEKMHSADHIQLLHDGDENWHSWTDTVASLVHTGGYESVYSPQRPSRTSK